MAGKTACHWFHNYISMHSSGNCSCLLWLLARRWFVHILSDMGFLLNSVTMKPTSNVVWQCVRISFAASMISLNVAYWHGCLWLTDLA